MGTELNIAKGNDLFWEVVQLTGLPSEKVASELQQILLNSGCSPENVTMDELRVALMQYMTTLLDQDIQ